MAGKGSAIRTTTYGGFKGVDFSTDASLVDTYRSPYSINMLADTGGMPEKRPGWRVLQTLEGPVHGVWFLQKDGTTHFVAHGGTKLYTWTGENPAEVALEGLHSGENSAGAVMGGKLYIVTGGDFISFDGTTAKQVEGYVPTTIIARAPAGGGTSYQSINLLTGRQRNEFIPDGTAKVYQLSGENLSDDPVEVTVRGVSKTEGTDFTVDRATGKVTFTTAPAAPAAGQEGEVIITFTKEVEGYRNRIAGCTILTTYGVGTNDRMIFSGNPDYPNLDWTSGLNDPTYVPDLSYSVVGGEQTAIMGYRRIGEYLAIIKEDNGQDSTVFMRSATTNTSGSVVFPLKQSIAGVGAVAKGGFGNILDDQLFLSRNGVFAITSNIITAERIVQNRSYYVDRLLTKEANLETAVAESWNGMYLVAINGHAYLLDGRQNKSYKPRSQGDFVYECYYWTNFPAVCMRNVKEGATETLLFGTADGKICRLNTDIETMARYNDDGQPIEAIWATKADDDGDVTVLKTMIKKGNSVTIKPYTRSSAKVCFRTNKDAVDWGAVEWQAAYGTMDIFDWSDIDFSRFTFNANDAPQEILFNTKVKKYKRLQIIIKNDALNEGFGIFSVTKHFVRGNFAKR